MLAHEDPRPLRKRVLVVDDDPNVTKAAARILRKHYDVTSVSSVAEAIAAVEHAKFDVVLSDVTMPDGGGIALWLRIMRVQLALAPHVVFMTGDTSRARAARSLPNRLLTKPFDAFELQARVADELARTPQCA